MTIQPSHIPFLYVNIFALCGFALMFIVFLATKKTSEIRSCLALILDCLVWTAGSILMRLQAWPGMNVWYYVSLVAIFSMELIFYLFLCNFARERGRFLKILFLIATLALIPGTLSGFYLPPPQPVTRPDGMVVYTYNTVLWHMAFPCVLFVAVVIASLLILGRMKREQGAHASGVTLLFLGGLIILAGNMMQIFIPGNTFPFDTLSGVIFAGFVTFALYRRRLFRMTLMVSHGLLTIAMATVCALLAFFFVEPAQAFLTVRVGTSDETAMMLVSIVLAVLLIFSYILLHSLTDVLFSREERQNKLVQTFSSDVSQLLSTDEIMTKLSDIVRQEIPVRQIYICLEDEKGYTAKYSSDPLCPAAFSIDRSSPKIRYLQEQEPYLIVSEFSESARAISDWAAEKELFRRLDIDCMAALRDGGEIVGLVLLAAKNRSRALSATEVGFVETVTSIASIAMKNAGLYEKMFREARIDSLTGAYNYRYFVEQEEQQFQKYGKDALTLLYVDVDDFKLYNQLYGVEEGDDALRRICGEIVRCAGSDGSVFRTSGKVFALLLPGQDAQKARGVAEEISRRVQTINQAPERKWRKPLSVSIGICSAPCAAYSAKELIDNTDLAAYNAKQSGKNRIVLFRGTNAAAPRKLAEKTDAIVDRVEREGGEYRTALSMISALTAAIDAKDHYTYAHSKNVARYAANLAVAAGLNDEQVRTIYAAGLLHDIGKISIPEDILNKTGKLDDWEYDVMKNHVNNSIEMIRHLPEMDYLIPAALGHHERWDGKGYPRGIAGEKIPVSARCLAIADVFDAMTTDRPYRKGLRLEYALDQIERGAGTQFDPHLALIFVQLVRGQEIPLLAQAHREA